MKTRSIRLTFSILALGALALPIFASADVKSEVTAAYNEAIKKFSKKDFDGLFKTCTPDATFKMADGKTYAAAQYKENLKEQCGPMTNIKIATKMDSFSAKGTTAVLNTTEVTDATIPGKDKKSHKFHMVGTYKYTLVKSGSIWKLKSLVTLTEKPMQDGKPMTGPP
jgi:ketosteroid isomerase-like protein